MRGCDINLNHRIDLSKFKIRLPRRFIQKNHFAEIDRDMKRRFVGLAGGPLAVLFVGLAAAAVEVEVPDLSRFWGDVFGYPRIGTQGDCRFQYPMGVFVAVVV